MEIENVPLPEDIVQGARDARGNFKTKNASYRRAVCNHLGLQWRSINGAGNCFFAAVSTSLLATLPPDRTDHLVGEMRLRALVVEWLEQQTRLEDDLAERVQAEIDAELHVRSFSHSFIVTSTNHQDDVHHLHHRVCHFRDGNAAINTNHQGDVHHLHHSMLVYCDIHKPLG